MFWSTLKYTFSFLLLLSFGVQAQLPDTLKVRNKFIPTGFRVGVDLVSPIVSRVSDNFTGWEVNADIDIYRFYLAADYGHWAATEPLKNGYYENDGKYARLGIDINFLKKDPDRNMFFLGFRIGRSTFKDSAAFTFEDTYYKTISKNLVNENLIGHWAELTTGLRVRMWRFFWMGYTARMKFSPSVTGEGELTSYDIPGYGVASRKLYWGFNYQLFFRMPFTNERPTKKR